MTVTVIWVQFHWISFLQIWFTVSLDLGKVWHWTGDKSSPDPMKTQFANEYVSPGFNELIEQTIQFSSSKKQKTKQTENKKEPHLVLVTHKSYQQSSCQQS